MPPRLEENFRPLGALPKLASVRVPYIGGYITTEPPPLPCEAMHCRNGGSACAAVGVLVAPTIIELHNDGAWGKFIGEYTRISAQILVVVH